MKRLLILSVLLGITSAPAVAQYAYTSTSLTQGSTNIYASTHVEVDYYTAYYYYVAMWSELDPNCSVNGYSSDCSTLQAVASGWSYGSSSASWSASVPISATSYVVFAVPEVVEYHEVWLEECYCYIYYDPYGYSLYGGEWATPYFYVCAYGPVVYTYTNVIPLGLAYSQTTVCPFPTGESSTWFGWEPGDSPYYMAFFVAGLQANPNLSFDDRYVYEDLNPYNPFDSCKAAWGSNSPFDPWNPPAGMSGAVVGSIYYGYGPYYGVYYGPYHNGYGMDAIGWPNSYSASVTWYQNQMRNGYPVPSCYWAAYQHMYMNGCPGSPQQYYEPGHSIGGFITSSTVYMFRAGAYATR